MAKQSLISRFLSAFLLGLFLLSITPKKVLHDIVAQHTDTSSRSVADDGAFHLQQAGFHCQLDNLVAESPFETAEAFTIAKAANHHPTFGVSAVQNIQRSVALTCLRGPPVFMFIS